MTRLHGNSHQAGRRRPPCRLEASWGKAASLLLLIGLLVANPRLDGGVVINEIMYHAPGDLADLQYIELHNADTRAADLSGWSITKGVQFTFPEGFIMEPGGFAVLCKDRTWFQAFYSIQPAGVFSGNLSRKGEKLEITDRLGNVMDRVRYRDRSPWPLGPDGFSASLERITPTVSGSLPENWAGSSLSTDPRRPGGSPGQTNTTFSPVLPPVIVNSRPGPGVVEPGQPLTVEAEIQDQARVLEVQVAYRVGSIHGLSEERRVPMEKGASGRFGARIPGQPAGHWVRWRIVAENEHHARRILPAANEPRPAFTHLACTNLSAGPISSVLLFRGGSMGKAREPAAPGASSAGKDPDEEPPVQGTDTMVWFEPGSQQVRLFDFVTIRDRPDGWMVHLHHDHLLHGMSTVHLTSPSNDRFMITEPLAFQLFRMASNAACQSDFARLWLNGKQLGCHLVTEQINKAYLRRHHLRDDGNLYKALPPGEGPGDRHEKRTNLHTDQEDLLAIERDLLGVQGAEQWAMIKARLHVEQVLTFFAVNALLSSWDGFSTNYFAYHDIRGSGRWELHAWEPGRTFGYHDGLKGPEPFAELPLSMDSGVHKEPHGSRPAGEARDIERPWRLRGGLFSRILLSNHVFLKHYHARIRELLESTFTEERLLPWMESMLPGLMLGIADRARLRGEDVGQATARMEAHAGSIRTYIQLRRRWLLAQPEIRNAGALDRTQLK